MQRLWMALLLFCLPLSGEGWSPAASDYAIAFVSERDGRRGVFVMQPDGREVRRLTDDELVVLMPSSWSPDGGRILFFPLRAADRKPGQTHIPPFHMSSAYAMDPDGGKQGVLIDLPLHEFHWSPDGRKLVFASAYETYEPAPSEKAGPVTLYLFDVETRRQTRLTALGNKDLNPNWSPDGSSIVFSSTRNGNRDIYAIDATGQNLRRLTTGERADVVPAWSPDGRSIAFVSAGFDGSNLVIMDADGRKQRVLHRAGG